MSQTIASGLTLGSIYAFVAMGLVIGLLPTRTFNFAQGAVSMIGGFLGYWLMTTVGVPELVAVGAIAAIGLGVGAVSELVCVRPLRRQGRRGAADSGHTELITTVGMATLLVGVAGVIWGYEPKIVPFNGPTDTVTLLGARMQPVEIALIAGAVVLSVALNLWARLTRSGQAVLAVAEDRDAAMLRGINVSYLSLGAWAIAGAVGAMAGLLVTPVTYAFPELGSAIVLPAFVALSIGGFNNFFGALVGGLTLGLVSAFATRYLGSTYKDIAILATLLLTFVVRPQGLAGATGGRTV
jgi:branched-chain amino acid transport system permease protein